MGITEQILLYVPFMRIVYTSSLPLGNLNLYLVLLSKCPYFLTYLIV